MKIFRGLRGHWSPERKTLIVCLVCSGCLALTMLWYGALYDNWLLRDNLEVDAWAKRNGSEVEWFGSQSIANPRQVSQQVFLDLLDSVKPTVIYRSPPVYPYYIFANGCTYYVNSW